MRSGPVHQWLLWNRIPAEEARDEEPPSEERSRERSARNAVRLAGACLRAAGRARSRPPVALAYAGVLVVLLVVVAATAAASNQSPDSLAPSAPTGVSAARIDETDVTVGWAASTDNVAVRSYRLFRNGTQVAAVASTLYTFSGLACGTTYTLGIAALDESGNLSPTTVLTASTATCADAGGGAVNPPGGGSGGSTTPGHAPDTVAPSVPGGLVVSGVGPVSVGLSWHASTDNVGVAGYRLYRGGVQVGHHERDLVCVHRAHVRDLVHPRGRSRGRGRQPVRPSKPDRQDRRLHPPPSAHPPPPEEPSRSHPAAPTPTPAPCRRRARASTTPTTAQSAAKPSRSPPAATARKPSPPTRPRPAPTSSSPPPARSPSHCSRSAAATSPSKT